VAAALQPAAAVVGELVGDLIGERPEGGG
jgi:hypothetical protein